MSGHPFATPPAVEGSAGRRLITRLKATLIATAALVVGVAAGLSAGFLLFSDNDSHGDDMTQPEEEQVILFLDLEITDQQRSDLETAMANHPAVASFTYWDEASSADEYRRIFADSQRMLDWLEANPGELPTSYRIVPTDTDAQTIRELATAFENEPGVQNIRAATDRYESLGI